MQREEAMVWVDRIWPPGRGGALRDILLVVAGVVLIALGAQVNIPMVPVPMTLQTLAVLLAGALLGFRLGVAATIAYLLAGIAGLPVFAGFTSAFGLAFLSLKSGGYVIGFVLCAAFVASLVAAVGRRPVALLLVMLGGHALVFLVGLPWLAWFIGPGPAVQFGLLPFLPGLLVKSVAAAAAVWLLGRPVTDAAARRSAA